MKTTPTDDDQDIVDVNMEYDRSPTLEVIFIALLLWVLTCVVLWFPIGLSIGKALVFGSLLYIVVYCGFLYQIFWAWSEGDKIIVLQNIFERVSAGKTNADITDPMNIPNGIRALPPGLNAILFERQFGKEIDVTKIVLCPIKLHIGDSVGDFWDIEGAGPITPIKGKYAARYPFIDQKAAETFFTSVFERAFIQAFSEGKGKEISRNPQSLRDKFELLLGGEHGVVKSEILWAHTAGAPFISKIEPAKTSEVIQQITPRIAQMTAGIEAFIKAGVSKEQATLLTLVASGEPVDLNQVNLTGMGGATNGTAPQNKKRRKKRGTK